MQSKGDAITAPLLGEAHHASPLPWSWALLISDQSVPSPPGLPLTFHMIQAFSARTRRAANPMLRGSTAFVFHLYPDMAASWAFTLTF